MYTTEFDSLWRLEDDGTRTRMSNFTAEIIRETRYVDGIRTQTILTIQGTQRPRLDDEDGTTGPLYDAQKPIDEYEPIILPPIEVEAESFTNLNWVTPNWGMQAIIFPGGGIKDDLRTAIQLRSKPIVTTIYKHLGWATIDKQRAFLHAGGAITKKGNNPNRRREKQGQRLLICMR